MSSVVRNLATDTQAEIIKQHTRPVNLVVLHFVTGAAYLSETRSIDWGGHTYLESAVRVGAFTWTSDGEQTGTLMLINENSSASAIVLNNAIQGVAVSIYQTYLVDEETIISGDFQRDIFGGDTRVDSDADDRYTEGGPDVSLYTATFTTPELLTVGVLDGVDIGAEVTTLQVLTGNARTEFVPNKFFCPETGFNHLPVPGSIFYIGQEKFVLEAED